MSGGFASVIKTLEGDVPLGLGIVVVIIGLLLRVISPFEIFVELWLISVAGTVIVGFGLLIVVVGLIHFLTDKGLGQTSKKEEKHISQKEFDKKYSEVSLANSSASVQAIKAMAIDRKPLNRKEIAEKASLSNTHTGHVLKSFLKMGYVLEFQVRDTFYYALSEKGLKLYDDIQTLAQTQNSSQSQTAQNQLTDGWLQRKLPMPKSPYYSQTPLNGLRGLIPNNKQRILRHQLILILSFFGGLFIHFEVNSNTLLQATSMSTTPLLLTSAMLVWIASTILSTRKVAGKIGLIPLALAWTSGFTVASGDPLTSLGVTLIISSTAIGTFAALYK